MWILRTEPEAQPAISFRILPGSVKTVGRAPAADFVVNAGMVSRIHCRLSAGATELEVEDLGSTNGTFVNGKRVRRAAVKSGDRLAIGRLELVIRRHVLAAGALEASGVSATAASGLTSPGETG